jgi:hypothetical protein
MTDNTKFAIFMLLFLLVSMVVGAPAQGGLIILPAQTSIAGCTWPTANVTVINGGALCPLSLSTGPALAIAVNGGAFVQIPMAAGASITGTAPIVVSAASVVSCPSCATSPSGTGGPIKITATAQ